MHPQLKGILFHPQVGNKRLVYDRAMFEKESTSDRDEVKQSTDSLPYKCHPIHSSGGALNVDTKKLR